MNPKIIIERASPVYEKNLIKVKDYVMPSDEVYEEKIRQVQEDWDTWGEKIFNKLRQITKLEWRDKDIRCYVVSGAFASFSHPLTLKIYDDREKMFKVLVHELIHRLLHSPEHPEKTKEARRKLIEPYKDESVTTKNHIVLHALHAQVILELEGEEAMQKVINAAFTPDYIRSWNIVKEIGREKILEQMFEYKTKN
jgi:hypothetical protein